jgi:uncharacterized protein YraI
MENLAFLHASTAYEDPSEAPTVRSLEDIGLTVNPAMLGVAAGAVAGFVVLGHPSDAQALVGYGDRGSEVYAVQQALYNRGYNTGGVDGVFGTATERAVINYQASNGLSADGVVGPATSSSLGIDYDGDNGEEGGGGGPDTVTVSTNGSPLTVRSGPGSSYGAIDYLSNGTSVRVLNYSGGWYEIAGGGWISSAWTVEGGSGGGGGGTPGDGGSGSIVISTNGSELTARSGPGSGYGASGYYANGAVVRFYDYYAGWYLTDLGWVSGDWVYER